MISSVGPQGGASQTVGGSTLPSSPTPRQVFMKTSGGSEGFYICFSAGSWVLVEANTGAGTVTSVSIVSANGQSGSVANPTTTPAITLNNPTALVATTSVTTPIASLGTVSSVTGQLRLAHASSANLTTITAGNAAAARTYVWPTNFGSAGAALTDAAGNGTLSWVVPSAGIAGSTGATDNAILRADGTGGATLQSSTPTINDGGFINFTPDDWNTSGGVNRLYFETGSATYINGTNALNLYVNGTAYGTLNTTGFGVRSTGGYSWSSNADPTAAPDTRLERSAAGVVEVNNGAAGQFRDIKVRDAFLDGEKSLAALATDSNGKIVVAASDARLKDVAGDFDAGLAEILAIEPQRFTWKDGRMAGMQAGLIAQNVQDAIPLAVSAVDDEMGTLQINKDAVIAALINACKELSARIEMLETKGENK